MKITKEDILKIKKCRIINISDFSKIKGVSIDSRAIKRNEIFFAILGSNFDGHDFIADVLTNGALFAVVNEKWYNKNADQFKNDKFLVVPDTTKALGELAKSFRNKFTSPVLAITGSNGKTTTKEMISAVLSRKYKVLKTEGNLNNHIGVPLMIFKLTEKHDFAVIEIGTNHFGEIKYLCDILQPDYGLITNVGKSHLEFFKDLNGVRKAKGELFKYLGKHGGTGFINTNDKYILKESNSLEYKVEYGFDGKYDYSGKRITGKNNQNGLSIITKNDRKIDVYLKILGAHNIINALAAAAVGLTFNVSPKEIQSSLLNFKPSSKRMESFTKNGIKLLNDCYNSNPDSVKAALETIKGLKIKGKKIAVLGDMLEIGTKKEEEHKKIAELIILNGIDYVFLYGPLSKNTLKGLIGNVKFCKHYLSKDELSKDLFELAAKDDCILLKGSRGMKMETIITDLLNN